MDNRPRETRIFSSETISSNDIKVLNLTLATWISIAADDTTRQSLLTAFSSRNSPFSARHGQWTRIKLQQTTNDAIANYGLLGTIVALQMLRPMGLDCNHGK